MCPRARRIYASAAERSRQAQEAALGVRGLKMSLSQGVAPSLFFGADRLLSFTASCFGPELGQSADAENSRSLILVTPPP